MATEKLPASQPHDVNSSSLELATARALEAGRGYEPHAVAAVSLCFKPRHQVFVLTWPGCLMYVTGHVDESLSHHQLD